MSSIELRSVTVRYSRNTVVRAFSDRVGSGEWLGVIGPNGAGKSSLLKAVAGVVPSSGEVIVDGAPLALRSRSRRAALVAYVPDHPRSAADRAPRSAHPFPCRCPARAPPTCFCMTTRRFACGTGWPNS